MKELFDFGKHPVVFATELCNTLILYDSTFFYFYFSNSTCKKKKKNEQHINRLEITPDKQLIGAAGNSHVRFFETNSTSTSPVMSL